MEYTQTELRDAILQVIPYAKEQFDTGELGEAKALGMCATPMLLGTGGIPDEAARTLLLTAMRELYDIGYFVNLVRDR